MHISSTPNTSKFKTTLLTISSSIPFKTPLIIMGVYTYEHEIASTIAPARLFKAFLLDADNIIAKIVPHAVKNVEILEGNGGPGTIKKITFGEGKLTILCLSPRLRAYFTYHKLKQNRKIIFFFLFLVCLLTKS